MNQIHGCSHGRNPPIPMISGWPRMASKTAAGNGSCITYQETRWLLELEKSKTVRKWNNFGGFRFTYITRDVFGNKNSAILPLVSRRFLITNQNWHIHITSENDSTGISSFTCINKLDKTALQMHSSRHVLHSISKKKTAIDKLAPIPRLRMIYIITKLAYQKMSFSRGVPIHDGKNKMLA